MVHLVTLNFPKVLQDRAWETCFWSEPSPDGVPKAVRDASSNAEVVFRIESYLFCPKRLTYLNQLIQTLETFQIYVQESLAGMIIVDNSGSCNPLP